MYKVLVACYANWETLAELPYVLKKGGCHVEIYCSPKSWLLSNRYYDRWIESHEELDVYREELLKTVQSNKYDWVILGDDLIIKYMNEVVPDELFNIVMPIRKIESRYILGSKEGLSVFCKENNIDTPNFTMYNTESDKQKIIDNLKFPVIHKLDFSWGGTDMFISNDKDELEENINKIPLGKNVLFQEYIKGEEIQVEALFKDGTLINYTSSNILEFSKSEFSYTTRRTYYENKKIKPLLALLGEKLMLNGFANICYIHQKETDVFHLLEVDPRPNSWIQASKHVMKNNFIEGVKIMVAGGNVKASADMGIYAPTVEVALLCKDIRRVLWNKDMKGLSRWLFNRNGYWRFIPLYDLKLTRRIIKEVWNEVFVYKWKRLTGQIKD